MNDMIEITGVDLRKLIQAAYGLSVPQGLGFLQARPGELDEASIYDILEGGNERWPVNMDYVRGRAVKLRVRSEDGKLYIDDRWYDHTPEQLRMLLKQIGVKEGWLA